MNARPGGVSNKFSNEKSVQVFFAHGSSGVVDHAGWTIYKVFNSRGNVSCLSFPAGNIHFFIHPYLISVVVWITVFTELPVGSPSDIRTVHDVNQALTLTSVVSVVVFADHVTIFIKHKLMCISVAIGEHFKITAIRIGSYDNATVGMFPLFSAFIGAAESDITNLPVDFSFRSHFNTRHAMAAETHVDTISV